MDTCFSVGNRVRYSGRSNPWIENGEIGTIVGWSSDYVARVSWDEFRDCRHSCGGECRPGHGWNVYTNDLEHDDPVDFGEFAAPDSIEELFTL